MSPPLRVLRIIARLNVGGPARHATLLDEHMRRRGFHSLLVYGSVGPFEGSLEDVVRDRGLSGVKIDELGRRIHPYSDVVALWHLTRLVFRERPDIVHTHTAKAGALGRLAAACFNLTRPRSGRCVVVHTFHGHVFNGYFGRVSSAVVRTIERALALLTDRIVTVSDTQKGDICTRFRIAPEAKTQVIELGIEAGAVDSLAGDSDIREELGFARDDVVYGYVGRFVAIKDLPTLIRAFAAMSPHVPNARLMLVGDGEIRTALEALVRGMEIHDTVRFTGWRRDLGAVYDSIDVGVLSSLNEGTPVALLEAMAAGKPVIATAVGGVEDVVRHGITGLVVPPADVDALAGAMARLGRDREARRRLGLAAQRDVASRFSPDRLVNEIIQLYMSALAEKRGDNFGAAISV